MSTKVECPACHSYTSSIAMAFATGSPCPACGLSAQTANEIMAVQRKRADDDLKSQVSDLLIENDMLKRNADNARSYLVEIADYIERWQQGETA